MQNAINCGRSVQKCAQKRHSSVTMRPVMYIEVLADF